MADYAAANPVNEIDNDPIGNLEVMSPRKAALYLGIGKTTIYRYLESGQLKALKLASKTLIRKTDLDELFVYNPSALTPPPKKERKQDKEYYTARQIMELLGMSMYPKQKVAAKWIFVLGHKLQVKVVAANDVHFISEAEAPFHDLMLCEKTHSDPKDPDRFRYTGQEWFKSLDEMEMNFLDHPEALENTMEIFNKVDYGDISELI